jgi:CheY-like chemotaxis protein
MVKQLTELQGGAVAVASAEGEGACFATWLPLGQAKAADLPRPAPGEPLLAGLRQGTALVVEDDDQAAELVRLLLEAEGFEVLRAASAEEALRMAPLQRLALITLDVQLPGLSGWEFLSRIRDDPGLAQVPVVVIAGDVDGNLALQDGALGLLQKPVTRGQLRDSLDRLGLHEVPEETRTVLVVDDDHKAVELIAAYLPSPAYAVVRAYGGAEAISLARTLRPDLILLDLMMPEVNGFDVVQALQQDPETEQIPILVVTAKHITARDRATLTTNGSTRIQIVNKAGFDRASFLVEVRRALPPLLAGASRG